MAAVAVPGSLTAVKACHASGKTFTAAELVLWWVFAQGGIAITTAPGWNQVEKLMWTEVHKAYHGSRFPLGGRLLDTELKVRPGVYALGLSTDEGVRFQGFHGKVLVVVDEATGTRPDIWEAIEGIRAGGDVRVLMLGNPTLASGPFYDAFAGQRALWQTFTIDAFATPNLAGLPLDELRTIPASGADDPRLAVAPRPYLVTRRWVWEKWHAWGESSPLWQSRVRGRFPSQSEDALIALGWLESAAVGPGEPPTEEPVAGIDVAGPGEDETVLAARSGGALVGLEWWARPDPRGEVLAALRRLGVRRANVDATGIGYYLARHLEDEGIEVTDVNVGAAPNDRAKFANLKAELYWGLREWFEEGGISGLTDDLAVSQLAGVRYRHDARGRVAIESKDEARRRGVKSPDRAEAIMLAFAELPPVYVGIG